MPAKSGGSHAAASFVSVFLGTIFSVYLHAHKGIARRLSDTVGSIVNSLLGPEAAAAFSNRIAGILVLSVMISFAWGMAYHYARHE